MRTWFNADKGILAACALALAAMLIGAPCSASAAGQDAVTVIVDHARVIRLPERTQTVIVGNPIIADVTLQRNGILVVTGKSYGVTNLIALDNGGTMLAESLIRVQAPNESLVTVQRGLERESYSCTPNCQPSVLLGDSSKYFSDVSGQAGQRNTLATQR
jgi:Flp pilus assembly secretin CpaC